MSSSPAAKAGGVWKPLLQTQLQEHRGFQAITFFGKLVLWPSVSKMKLVGVFWRLPGWKPCEGHKHVGGERLFEDKVAYFKPECGVSEGWFLPRKGCGVSSNLPFTARNEHLSPLWSFGRKEVLKRKKNKNINWPWTTPFVVHPCCSHSCAWAAWGWLLGPGQPQRGSTDHKNSNSTWNSLETSHKLLHGCLSEMPRSCGLFTQPLRALCFFIQAHLSLTCAFPIKLKSPCVPQSQITVPCEVSCRSIPLS